MKTRKAPQRLVGEVQILRIRVAPAESKVKMIREQAREAKRRRKEAKRNAQLVRRRFKQSKSDLSELREALAKAEAKLFQAGGSTLAWKASQAKRAAQTGARELVAVKVARPSRRSPEFGRKSARTLEERKAVASHPSMVPNRRQTAPKGTRPRRDAVSATNLPSQQSRPSATENPALNSLESITTSEPVTSETREPL